MEHSSEATEPTHIQLPDDGQVEATNEPRVTERDIHDDRENIIQLLDATYMQLLDQMQGFQQQWQDNQALAIYNAAQAGGFEGITSWWNDQGDFFDKETWLAIGQTLKNTASSVYDYVGTYVQQRYDQLRETCNRETADDEGVLQNVNWATCMVDTAVDNAAASVRRAVGNSVRDIEAIARDLGESADKMRKLYRHRDAILGLPDAIAAGDAAAVQRFVDTQLRDIDPRLADAIRNDPNFYVVLELINDHDSALSYAAYISLMLEAIPPNFYVYVAGRYGIYLVLEVALLVVLAFLTAGAATVARIAATVTVRLAQVARATQAGQRIEKAAQAVQAFRRMIESVVDATDRLHALGAKLAQARSRGLTFRGSTRTTLMARRQSVRRDRRCRLCGSSKHTTPRYPVGNVTYR